ncbi:MAG: DUF6596 domain-containing protein [Vicinamibacteraceae bacterium]
MTSSEAHAAIEAVWRLEAPKLTAGLMRFVRDLGVAEDLAHDALVAAFEQWPADGVPRNPGAWLMQAVRLASVLEVIYLVFNEGYAATAGEDWIRPSLCEEALRLGRTLATLLPADAEVHGLVGLMELHASRFRARVGPNGEAVLLLDQDRGRWDRLLIGRGLAALARAVALDGGGGFYALQAAIAACHVRAATPEATDWARIAALYARRVDVTRSPIVRLNHAVAVGRAEGPAAGLALVDALTADPSLAAYPYLPSARGDLLERLGRIEEARTEFERAATLTRNSRDRDALLARAGSLEAQVPRHSQFPTSNSTRPRWKLEVAVGSCRSAALSTAE